MTWINFLHLYQPANAEDRHIKEATEKSYSRIIRGLEEHPHIKFTLNITGCLLERWNDLGCKNLMERTKRLIVKKQIELTGTAAYHPLLPLVPVTEVIRQIKENEKILQKYFGVRLKPKGFFFPEMAYGKEAAKIVKKLGYEWIILDEISYNGKLNSVDLNKVYLDKTSGLKIIFRSRKFSNCYAPKIITPLLTKETRQQRFAQRCGLGEKSEVITTATDAELYGLRHEDPTAEFEKLLKNNKLKTLTVSEFINITPPTPLVRGTLRPSSWESMEKESGEGRPYALWQNPKNKIQKALWQLADLACQTLEQNKNDKNYSWARWHLVRGLASCTFWWASGRDLAHVFGPVAWGPDEIEKGLNDLTRAIRSLENKKIKTTKLKAEKLNAKIRLMIWEKHWDE